MQDALVDYFDDMLTAVPAERRAEVGDFVVRRAAASPLPPTREAIDALIAEGCEYFGIDDWPQWVRERGLGSRA